MSAEHEAVTSSPGGHAARRSGKSATAVLHVGGMYRSSEKAVVEAVLGRRPGVLSVEANPVSQTANVTYDASATSLAELRRWVEECGMHCAGQSVPTHVCDPMEEPDPAHAAAVVEAPPAEHGAHAPPAEETLRAPEEVMGHGGHAGMSMDAMVRDMRNRFLVAAVMSVPILLWSPIGREVLGFDVPAPFGLRDDVFALLLSLPVIFYSAWIFFDGAYHVAGTYNRLASEVGGRAIEHESMVNLPNWLPLRFRPEGGSWSAPSSTRLLDHRQVLDLRSGILDRRSRVTDSDGRVTAVSERRLVSMTSPHLAALEQVLTPENWSGTLEVRAGLDGRVANTNVAEDRLLANVHLAPVGVGGGEGEGIWLEMETTQSHVRVAEAARLRLRSHEADGDRRIVPEPGLVVEEAAIEAGRGQPIVVEKVVAIWTSRDRAQSDPLTAARADAADAPGFDRLLAEHRQAWEHLWKRCRLDLGGEGADVPLLVRLHAFHVLQTLSPHVADLDVGVPARGLHGEGYRAHVFWDELFVLPFLNLRLPELTRALLLYRARRLPAARREARAMGGPGARFPWQSGADGSELTPTQLWNARSRRWIPDNSRRQHHVSLAVAWNLWQYYQATGDERFLAEHGAEMLVEIARFWAGLASPDGRDGRYDIRGVMGPDEFHDGYPDRPGRGIETTPTPTSSSAGRCSAPSRCAGSFAGSTIAPCGTAWK